MTEQVINAIGEKAFGTAPLKVSRKTIGICNEVYELTYPSTAYILRMNKEQEWIYGTHKFLPIFQQLGIKVPTIVEEDYSKAFVPVCYQIQSKIKGSDLALVSHQLSYSQLQSIAKEISHIYDQFNTLPDQQDFGGLTGMREDRQESQLTIIQQRRVQILERNQVSKVIDAEIIEIHQALVDKYQDYFQRVKPKLYFDDMSSKNVMIHEGKFNGLVDLDFLMKGDYLEGIGGIIADWYGSEAGLFYIHELLKYQGLSIDQQKVAKVYAIFHLILWTSEEGIRFNGNSSGTINWDQVKQKKEKILQLFQDL